MKFNIGDKVRANKFGVTDYQLSIDLEMIVIALPVRDSLDYLLKGNDEYNLEYWAREEHLELIEQDIKEHTPTDEEIETDTSFEDTKESGMLIVKCLRCDNLIEVHRSLYKDDVKYICDDCMGKIGDIPKSIEKQAPMPLDYEKEYKLLLEEYKDLNEELYIAKTAIKMLSELL
jgi:chromosome segregation ATPase